MATSGSEGSESASDSEQNDPPSSLASDAEQYERIQALYLAVGRDFHDQEDFIGSEYRKLQRLERCMIIIELFGVMCQNSPKDGSHLFSQIK